MCIAVCVQYTIRPAGSQRSVVMCRCRAGGEGVRVSGEGVGINWMNRSGQIQQALGGVSPALPYCHVEPVPTAPLQTVGSHNTPIHLAFCSLHT